MQKADLFKIVEHCDKTFRAETFTDYDGAVNGLQVENSGVVTRVAATVDASLATVRMAVEAGADLLIVHHGLFWSPTVPWTGRRYELLDLLISNNVAVYSMHLPLDAHRTLGNNALLCSALAFKNLKPFFFEKEQFLGYRTNTKISRAELAKRLTRTLGHSPTILPGGSESCQRIGVVTGGAGSQLKKAAAEGVDTFITGEGPHWTYALAEELRINVFYGGHYATETFGVKALAAEIGKKFRVPWSFLDHPTGL
ncbi:MAG: Nif3-like dinuclear metal center hexameric protein [Limisphaerales bacterium]